MTSMLNLKPALFTDNIIAQAEFRHQRYIIQNSRSGPGWILMAVVMLLPGILMSFVLLGLAVSGTSITALLDFHGSRVTPLVILAVILHDLSPVTVGMVSLIVMNIALYFVVMLVTVALASNSITREKTSKTWDVLLLTNVDADRLVVGKWWASLRGLAGDHLMLVILRMGAFGLLIAETHDRLPTPPLGLPSGLFYTVLMALFVLAYSALDAGFAVALGIALPLSTLPGAVMTVIVLGVRLVAIVYNFAFGVVLAAMVAGGEPFLVLGAVSLLVGALLNWLALRLAQFMAVRGAVSAAESAASQGRA